MMTAAKIKAIKKQLRRGEPAGEIKFALRNEGYPETDIDKAFAPRNSDMRSWFLSSSILLFFAGLLRFPDYGSFLLFIGGAVMATCYFKAIKDQEKQQAEDESGGEMGSD